MYNYFLCGAAKNLILPPKELLVNLHGLMSQEFGGIIDDIYVRVLYLEGNGARALLVSFDLDKVPFQLNVLDKLSKEFKIPTENIMITAVHTHSAPIAGVRPGEGPNNPETKPERVKRAMKTYEIFLEERLIKTAKDAYNSRRPAKVGIGTTESYINVYRNQWYEYRNKRGEKKRKCALGYDFQREIDRTVTVFEFQDESGRPIAFWINYPVHCCVLHVNKCCNGKMGISGDIGGTVSQMLEKKYEGSIALWTSGAAGDINPIRQVELYMPDPENGDIVSESLQGDTKDLMYQLAQTHYEDICRMIPRISCNEMPDIKGAVVWSTTAGKFTDYRVRLHMLRIGQAILTGASGELYSFYAKRMKQMIPESYVVAVNHEMSLCANSGYIFDDEILTASEVDLPGMKGQSMLPGKFSEDFTVKMLELYEKVTACES